MVDNGGEGEGECSDFISSLPDEILQHILFFSPTKTAIKTSALSKRWRHIWSETSSLYIDFDQFNAESIDQTLTRYKAPKIVRFVLRADSPQAELYVDKWIKIAISKDAENMSIRLPFGSHPNYIFPDFFYMNSSVKRLIVELSTFDDLVPKCSVTWTSLRKLCLITCNLPDQSISNILSGCPMLESLVLSMCDELHYLDLSRSLCLRNLKIVCTDLDMGPLEIVAPHIYSLELINFLQPCIFVDVSSLAEANINIFCYPNEPFAPEDIQDMVLKMLEKLQNVEKLTFGATFLQFLSLAELRGLPFPTLKVEALFIETMIVRSVVPGLVRLLQNSPRLKKLTIHTKRCNILLDECFDKYLEWEGLNPNQCWSSIDGDFPTAKKTISSQMDKTAEPKVVISFMEVLIKNANTLDTLVVRLGSYLDTLGFDELLQLAATLSHDGVLIVLK